ncbi:MAG: hypothetical protein ACTSUE_01940 [Promethearchaeota archaeon]
MNEENKSKITLEKDEEQIRGLLRDIDTRQILFSLYELRATLFPDSDDDYYNFSLIKEMVGKKPIQKEDLLLIAKNEQEPETKLEILNKMADLGLISGVINKEGFNLLNKNRKIRINLGFGFNRGVLSIEYVSLKKILEKQYGEWSGNKIAGTIRKLTNVPRNSNRRTLINFLHATPNIDLIEYSEIHEILSTFQISQLIQAEKNVFLIKSKLGRLLDKTKNSLRLCFPPYIEHFRRIDNIIKKNRKKYSSLIENPSSSNVDFVSMILSDDELSLDQFKGDSDTFKRWSNIVNNYLEVMSYINGFRKDFKQMADEIFFGKHPVDYFDLIENEEKRNDFIEKTASFLGILAVLEGLSKNLDNLVAQLNFHEMMTEQLKEKIKERESGKGGGMNE